jgi:FMN phosphatase YigB (HAD superfamily)
VIRAVLLDFSDTLFWRDGPPRIVSLAAEAGVQVPSAVAAQLWEEIRIACRTDEEVAKGRDRSAAAHRECWVQLYRPLDRIAPGLAESLYEDQRNPAGWHPFPDTIEVLRALHAASIPVAVVSDIGWDIRPIFAHYGVADTVRAWVLSFAHGIEKPDPRMFQMPCDIFGVGPEDALMVGDDLRKDGGATAMGMRALVLPHWTGIGDRGLRIVPRLVFGPAQANGAGCTDE